MTHLSRLFSAFGLAAPDHCALYAHLLACFHAASLDHPRPILFVDSWVPERGKSEVGSALATLLDGAPSSIPLAGTRDQITEQVTAHLLRGGRTLVGHNLSARESWNNVFLVSLSTDDNVSQRPKYGRETVSFPGVVVVLNGVYGEFSLHPDVITRIFRVQLPGDAGRLDPAPRTYARRHRDDIISEILEVHRAAAPWRSHTLSRFADFEEAGLSAYARAFKLSHEEVQERFSRALRGAWGLAPEAVSELFRVAPEAFSGHAQVAGAVRSGRTRAREGARGLGFVYNSRWTKE